MKATKKYCIVHKVDQNSNCPAAHLVGSDHVYKNGNSGIIRVKDDSLESCNNKLFEIAAGSVDNAPAAQSAKTWGLFAANINRLYRQYKAFTDFEGCRHFHDDDVDGYFVKELALDDNGEPDYRETI